MNIKFTIFQIRGLNFKWLKKILRLGYEYKEHFEHSSLGLGYRYSKHFTLRLG